MTRPLSSRDWAGAVAVTVAFFVSAGWAVAMVAAAVDDDVSVQGVQLLAGLGGVLAGAVAGYLGASVMYWRRHIDTNTINEESES